MIDVMNESDLLRANIAKLRGEISDAEDRVAHIERSCHHEWGDGVYDPKIVTKAGYYGDEPGTMGVDYWPKQWFPETKQDRWSRTCTKCGKVEYPVARAWAYWFAAMMPPSNYEYVSECEYVMLIEGLEAIIPRALGLPEDNALRQGKMSHTYTITFRDGVYLRLVTNFGKRDGLTYPDADEENLTEACRKLAKSGGFYEFSTGFDDVFDWWYARFYRS